MEPDPVISVAAVTAVVDLAKAILGLFAEFPLNVLVIGGISVVAFRFIRGAKRISR